jgi:hypothetical protein
VKEEPHRGGLGTLWLSKKKDYCLLQFGGMSQDKSLVIKTFKGSELIVESQNKKKLKSPTPSKLTEEKEREASLPGRAVLPIA